MMRTRRIRRSLTVAAAATLILGLAACSGGDPNSSAPNGAGESDGVLTIALYGDALDLDTANCVPAVFCNVAYDTLVRLSPEDGSIEPGLAESWEWVDETHTALRLTLRDDAKFNDGSPLTGDAAAASFMSYLTAPGPFAALSYPIAAAESAGDNQVDIIFAEPVTERYALYSLTGQSGIGYIVSPAAAADRKLMVDKTDGIGPYKLDPAQTQKGVRYVYVPNPEYYSQEAIAYERVVLQPMLDPAARLNAVRAGQIDWASNIAPADQVTAEDAGLTISKGVHGAFAALALQARDSGPLADVRVRQALAYATPREEITTAFYGPHATATSSMVPQGAEGYAEGDVDAYATDIKKAKALLADAGYADGLSITVFDPAFFDPGNVVGQALANAYAEIGVTVELVPFEGNPGEVAMQQGQYDAMVITNGGNGISAAIYTMFRPGGGLVNPKQLPLDDELSSLMKAAAAADSAEQEELAVRVTERLNELVYAVPIAQIPTVQAIVPGVENVPAEFWSITSNPFSPVPDQAWRG
ncbi:ABC transporter substrate-binding protein [Salinibacterium sp. GXW1014]|uniref:ABC transporter substrate-binding protein n=1 Tax=Salinibacterium sp. GXW1014 TaxID=3377838 RepID=UPI00383AF7D6